MECKRSLPNVELVKIRGQVPFALRQAETGLNEKSANFSYLGNARNRDARIVMERQLDEGEAQAFDVLAVAIRQGISSD